MSPPSQTGSFSEPDKPGNGNLNSSNPSDVEKHSANSVSKPGWKINELSSLKTYQTLQQTNCLLIMVDRDKKTEKKLLDANLKLFQI